MHASPQSVSAEPVEARLSTETRPSTGSGLTDFCPTLRFAGYAALFDRVDRGGDVIRAGAFGALDEGCELPLLWQHRPGERIGRVTHASEDARGLRVIGEVSGEAAALLRAGAVRGLSFGYRATDWRSGPPRELLALDVLEISLVTHPMQPGARVHMILNHSTKPTRKVIPYA